MKKFLLTTAILCGQVALAQSASAQSIDYAAMRDMFGEPVTTSATGKPQRASDVPVTMEILTQDDIRRSGAVSLAEALRGVNGLNVVQKGEHQYDIGIRGYNNNFSTRLLVLVNGRQVYLDYLSYTNWASMPIQLDEIQQVEIVKGSNTALFGFNAVGGVINIVTLNPLYDDKTSVKVTAGTTDYLGVSGVQSVKLTDKFGVRLSAGGHEMNSYNNPANGTAAILTSNGTQVFNDPSQGAVNLDAMYQLTPNSQARLELSGVSTKQGHIVPNGDAFREEQVMRSAKVGYELDSEYGLIKANVYKNFMRLASSRQAATTAFGVTNTELVVAQLEDTYKLNKDHTIRGGLEFRDNTLKSDTFTLRGAEVSYNVYAASAMWDWAINDKMSWTNAARVDYLDLDRNGPFTGVNPNTNEDYQQVAIEYSYNSGFVWKPTTVDTVRLTTARGLELPSLFEYGSDFIAGPTTLVGNPRLNATVVTNYEVAWDRTVDQIDGMIRTALFYQKLRDVKSYRAQTVFPTVLTRNIGSSDSIGFELSADGKINQNFDWGAGYIYQRINDNLANGKNGLAIVVPREYEDANPVHQANLKLGYHEGGWEADTLVYYVSRSKGLGYLGTASILEQLPAYVGVNARVGYGFENGFTVALHGQQLQSAQQQTSTAPDVDRSLYLTVSKDF